MKGQDVDLALNSADDVFVLGRDGAANAGEYSVWKNGNKIIDIKDVNANVNKLFAKGSDVYICGGTTINGQPKAAIWKNGTVQVINSSREAYTVSVSENNDLYVGLTDGTILKNNVVQPTLRSAAGNTISFTGKIFCSGTDVFVLGYCISGNETIVWKNGTQIFKITSPIAKYDLVQPQTLFVSGNDVYCSGILESLNSSSGGTAAAVIFKNGSLYKTLYEGVGYLVDAPSIFVK